jgi:hypothetical protein
VTAWWAWEDSNLKPDRYERSALTIETGSMRARLENRRTPRGSSTSSPPAGEGVVDAPDEERQRLAEILESRDS